jgi:hypothetical protein
VPASGLYSLPTTTAVAEDVPPVITSPRFKHTCESPLTLRAVAVAFDPTLVSVSNLLCVINFAAAVAPEGVYSILDAGVQ